MSKRGEINGWKCDKCGRVTYGVHVDDGVTPMFLACRETPGCDGTGTSLMYPPPPIPAHVIENVEWEWYRPRGHRYGLRPAEADHVKKGGLLLRPISDAGDEALTEALSGTPNPRRTDDE